MTERYQLLAILLLLVLSFGGCAKRLVVTFESVPTGARCFMEQGGRLIDIGEYPTTRKWDITSAAEDAGYLEVPPLKYVWVSGATQASDGPIQFRIDNCEFSLGDPIGVGCTAYWTYTLHRPANAPGRELDLAYGIEADRNRQLGRQAAAQEERAQIERRRYWLELSSPARRSN